MKNEEEDARLSDRCEAKRKYWAKHWQCDEDVQNLEDKSWENEELKKSEEALPRLQVCELGKVSKLYTAKTGIGWGWLPPQGLLGCDKGNERRNRAVLGDGGAEWKVSATSMHDDVLLDSEECHE